MKLIIQIPCFNEAEHLGPTLADLPRSIPGVDIIETLVISDGSRDATVEVARACGVDHIVDLPINKGLAHGFMAGLDRALREGADIIVNTDADNQYRAADIHKLVRPILDREAEFVVGDRPIPDIAHFSRHKRALQHIGSWVVRMASGTKVGDAPSGFRALSREAALRINTFDSYTYTLETIVHAGLSDVRIVSVPIGVNGETRPSRLVRSIPDYVARSARSIVRTTLIYQPARSFVLMSIPLAVLGTILLARWLWLYVDGSPRAHVPSLLASAGLLLTCVFLWIAAVLGKLLAINRRLLQDIQYRLRKFDAQLNEADDERR
ncbi:glycosyltransferase family 2 protein [Sphingomonas sp. IC-56]|uniref:glycosyltransferase family 2 protein n=1 Tax=Sphingomonas sp. IC-56 TaxID=2898529 RepID=UPI001E5A0B2B|nr:glycosyltransferase family 2 protein [Sphingomonas sp. IC-56]